MLKIVNLFRYIVVSFSKALKIYRLLFRRSVTTVNRTEDDQPYAVYPSF
jgi:hypothetical protein